MTDLFSLTNKTAIVTGALGLLGKKHCEALATAGANVVVADINEAAAATFAAGLGPQHLGIRVDVTDKESLIIARDKILDRYQTIDILVNNAAINDMFENPAMAAELSAFENYPLDSFKKSLDVNVTGVFLASQVFGTVMANQGSGSIINIASTYGIVGPDQSGNQRGSG
jgi:NAD(P)-dependent dehydrogenase (short-subunit alcohol dehydrogenase family)